MSFSIPIKAIPGRISLLVTLFLMLVSLFISFETNAPKAKHLTALHVWHLACMFFVALVLAQYAMMLMLRYKGHHYCLLLKAVRALILPRGKKSKHKVLSQEEGIWMDTYSFRLFLFLFSLFVVIYCGIYAK